MAIIYTYPRLSSSSDEDLLIVTDVTDNSTKSLRIGDLPFTNNSGTVTSVGLTMPAAFAVADSPVTSSGTINVTGTGGSAGQFLAYPGTSWVTPGGNPAGSNTEIQFNNNGVFGADPGLSIDISTTRTRLDLGHRLNPTGRGEINIHSGARNQGFTQGGVLDLEYAYPTSEPAPGGVAAYAFVGLIGPKYDDTLALSLQGYNIQLPVVTPNDNTQTTYTDARLLVVNGTTTGSDPVHESKWISTSLIGGSDIEIEDEGVQVASAVEKIDFTGGGITASGDNTKVTVNVLPRLNQGFSPYPIYQGDENIDIASGATNAIGVQTIVDTAAAQITVARVFGDIPVDCVINVAVYSGELTSFVPSGTDTTALIAYGSTTAVASSAGIGIYRVNLNKMTPLPSATWAPVAGTPIVVVIEVDNSAGSTTAKILGTLAKTGSTITTDYGNALAFEMPGTSSVFTASNIAAGEEVSKLTGFSTAAEATEKRICHHFDPSAP